MKTRSTSASTGSTSVRELPSKVQTVKFSIAHLRDGNFYDALLAQFKRDLLARTGGRLSVDFVDGHTDGRQDAGTTAVDLSRRARQRVIDGSADIAQIEVSEFGLGVLECPFLFRSYDHAEAVWNGPVGAKLLETVSANAGGKVQGIAFAYSGGYRILVGQAPVRGADDFKGLRMRPVGQPLFAELGVTTVKLSPSEKRALSAKGLFPLGLLTDGVVDLEETEVNRFAYHRSQRAELKKVKCVNVTNHSMYVTMMAVNSKFLAGLDSGLRGALTEEIAKLAIAERKLTIALSDRHLASLAKDGVSVIETPKSEEKKYARHADKVCAKFPEFADTLRAIRAA